jgi:hypothetical protein
LPTPIFASCCELVLCRSKICRDSLRNFSGSGPRSAFANADSEEGSNSEILDDAEPSLESNSNLSQHMVEPSVNIFLNNSLTMASMTELAFARQFLTALDSRPIKLSSDHVSDPKHYPAQGAVCALSFTHGFMLI